MKECARLTVGHEGGWWVDKRWLFRLCPAIKGMKASVGLENNPPEGTEGGKGMAGLGNPSLPHAVGLVGR